MKKDNKFIGYYILTIILFLVCITTISKIVERKDSYIKYSSFFEQEADFDVLFMGSSHVVNGILPMELWDDYGIVSYNMGGHGNRLPTTYVVLKEALMYTNPKLVVLDCYNLTSDRMYSDSMEHVHLSLDSFPLTYSKVRGVYELFGDYKLGAEFLWDFVTYHNRWDSLTMDDFLPQPSPEKGAETKIGVATPNEVSIISSDIKFEGNTNGIKYLKKIIELCQEKNIEIVLAYLPFPANEEEQAAANRVADIANEYHVPYLNFLNIEDLVNYDTDCVDSSSHLNPSGAKKVTDYFGQYIASNYSFSNKHNVPAYQSWHDDYLKYIDYKISLLKKEALLNNYLMLLYDNDFTYEIIVDNSTSLLMDKQLPILLQNLDNNYSVLSTQEYSFSIKVFFNNKLVDEASFEDMTRTEEREG